VVLAISVCLVKVKWDQGLEAMDMVAIKEDFGVMVVVAVVV
jgi:hypothetical protein